MSDFIKIATSWRDRSKGRKNKQVDEMSDCITFKPRHPRHTYKTLVCKEGVQIADNSSWLGGDMERYAHVLLFPDKRGMKAVGSLQRAPRFQVVEARSPHTYSELPCNAHKPCTAKIVDEKEYFYLSHFLFLNTNQ